MHHVYAKTITRKCPLRLSNANRMDGTVVKEVMGLEILDKNYKNLLLNNSYKVISYIHHIKIEIKYKIVFQ